MSSQQFYCKYLRMSCESASFEAAGLMFSLVLVQGSHRLEVLVTQLAVGHHLMEFVGKNGKPITFLKNESNQILSSGTIRPYLQVHVGVPTRLKYKTLLGVSFGTRVSFN